MNDNKLFELRKKRVLQFDSIVDLNSKVNEIMADPLKITVVVGFTKISHNPEASWEVHYLKPHEKSDELTVMNYLEGLRKVEQEFVHRKDCIRNFKGILVFDGLESFHYSNESSPFMMVGIGDGNYTKYGLDIYLKKNAYHAMSRQENSFLFLEKTMERHLGPNTVSD